MCIFSIEVLSENFDNVKSFVFLMFHFPSEVEESGHFIPVYKNVHTRIKLIDIGSRLKEFGCRI